MTPIIIAQIASCLCCFPLSSVVIDVNGKCLYWFWNGEPDKHNPCGNDDVYVPENATPIFEEKQP